MPAKFYRYEAVQYAVLDQWGDFVSPLIPDPKIELREFNLHKETPKGYWIGYGSANRLKSDSRWIPKVSKKRFAYPTKAEALEGFIARTQRRANILNAQLNVCTTALYRAKKMREEVAHAS